MRWKVCVVIDGAPSGVLKRCFESLRNIGFRDGIHSVCGAGTSVPNASDISRQRVPGVTSEAALWAAAIEIIAKTYSTTDDVFLFVSPYVRLWRHIRPFVNATLEPDFVAAYFPYSPQRFYPEHEWQTPGCESSQAGWCQADMTMASEGSQSLILHRHSARLLSDYLGDFNELASSSAWSDTLAAAISRHKMSSYVATPSFATHESGCAVDFVADHSQGLLRPQVNYYLN